MVVKRTLKVAGTLNCTVSSHFLRVSTGHPVNYEPSAVFGSPTNKWMTCQQICFYWNGKAPSVHMPSNLAADGNATCAPASKWGQPKCVWFTQYSATPLFLARRHLKTGASSNSHQQQPNCFYWAMSWYFGTVTQHDYRQSLLTRNTQLVTPSWWEQNWHLESSILGTFCNLERDCTIYKNCGKSARKKFSSPVINTYLPLHKHIHFAELTLAPQVVHQLCLSQVPSHLVW